VHSLHHVAMRCCRGPLPSGHPRDGVVYFCPDSDVPLSSSGLSRTPVLSRYCYTPGEAVLLDAHRAPDEWFGSACRMDNLTVQGDPDAHRPGSCNLFAGELAKERPLARAVRVHLRCTATLAAALPLARGRLVVLCGSWRVRDEVYAHLRPAGMKAGDGAMDRYGKFTRVHAAPMGASVSVDGGRRLLRANMLEQHVVVSPGTVRAGEYDTIVVMPDVPESIGRAICRRTRYMIIGVGHSPCGYVL
jgi:hypothetical protein